MSKTFVDYDGYLWTSKKPEELEFGKQIGIVKRGMYPAKVYSTLGILTVECNGYYCKIEKLDLHLPFHKKIYEQILNKSK